MLRNTQLISRDEDPTPHMTSDQNQVRVGDVGTAHIEPFQKFGISRKRDVLSDEVVRTPLTHHVQRERSLCW